MARALVEQNPDGTWRLCEWVYDGAGGMWEPTKDGTKAEMEGEKAVCDAWEDPRIHRISAKDPKRLEKIFDRLRAGEKLVPDIFDRELTQAEVDRYYDRRARR